MSNAILTPEPDDDPVGWDTARLRQELANGLTLTAVVLTRLGRIWAELERRGEDLSDLRHGLARVLPLIASGLLAAEAVVAFAGRRAILRALEGLPLAEQRRLALGEPVEVALSIGSQKTERVPVASIPPQRLGCVFQDGQILSPAEQRVRMGRKKQPAKQPQEPERRYQPRYSRETGTVQVGRMTIHLADLLAELAAAAGPDRAPINEEDYQGIAQVPTRLTRDELANLRQAAEKAGLPEWELIRKALRAFGLI